MKTYTKKQLNTGKYANRYVQIRQIPSYMTDSGETEYELIKSFSTIHEDTTLGKDVGTENEYRR